MSSKTLTYVACCALAFEMTMGSTGEAMESAFIIVDGMPRMMTVVYLLEPKGLWFDILDAIHLIFCDWLSLRAIG